VTVLKRVSSVAVPDIDYPVGHIIIKSLRYHHVGRIFLLLLATILFQLFIFLFILGFHTDFKLVILLATCFILSFLFILPILHMKIFLDSLVWRVRPTYIMIFCALRRINLRLSRHAARVGATRNSCRKLVEYILKNKEKLI
jgi:hypothetical protein